MNRGNRHEPLPEHCLCRIFTITGEQILIIIKKRKIDIIVAEDDPMCREMLEELIRREGFSVRAAADGVEALALIEEREPDLLITDIMMPQKDGLELILSLRKHHSNVKVIAISGGIASSAGNFCFLKTAKKLGAVSTLRKPFSKIELYNTINESMNLIN